MESRITMRAAYTATSRSIAGTREDDQGVLNLAFSRETSHPAVAFSLYSALAGSGNSVAQYKCGVMLMNGHGVPQDVPLACHYLKAAASQGNVEAKEELSKYNPIGNTSQLWTQSKLGIIQAALPKENGYPTSSFMDALDLLHKQSLKPTLLLIDEVGIDLDESDFQTTKNQLKLIKKVQDLGGHIVVCTRSCQPDLKPVLKEAVNVAPHDFYSIDPLNKLENPDVHAIVQKADYVIVSGFDTNDCVRSTVGVIEDGRRPDPDNEPGLVQEKIPTLYSDYCARGMNYNRWETSRFESTLFFWGREDSSYRGADQAVREYREAMIDIPSDFSDKFDDKKLRDIQLAIFSINGLPAKKIKKWFLEYKISPNNPLLDQITKPAKR